MTLREAAQQAEVFTRAQNEWQVRIGSEVLSTVWNSRGAALAGLAVETRRRTARALRAAAAEALVHGIKQEEA